MRLTLADVLVLLICLGGKSVSAYGAEVLACILALAEDPFHEVATRACTAVMELNSECDWDAQQLPARGSQCPGAQSCSWNGWLFGCAAHHGQHKFYECVLHLPVLIILGWWLHSIACIKAPVRPS